jgi:FolB domain-containing protein
MDQILIKDLVAHGVIGINNWEHETPQEILINIVLSTDLRKAGKSDDLHDSVDYRSVAKKVLRHAETACKLTVEALADDLASICLQEARVEKVQGRVEKPGAVRFSRLVGVEIMRTKKKNANHKQDDFGFTR